MYRKKTYVELSLEAHRVVMLGFFCVVGNGLLVAGEIIGFTCWPPSSPRKIWYSFLLQAESTLGHSAARMIRSNEKSNDISPSM
jgi:hypothetical protein